MTIGADYGAACEEERASKPGWTLEQQAECVGHPIG